MKKFVLLCMAVAMCVPFASCKKNDNTPHNLDEWMRLGYPPEFYDNWKDHPDGSPDPTYPEGFPDVIYSGDDFICYPECGQYSKDIEKIIIKVECVNAEILTRFDTGAGQGFDTFYYCNTPRIERLSGNVWERIHYLYTDNEWHYFGSGSERAHVTIKKKRIFPKLTAGEYRAIVYVGKTCTPLFAYFEVTG